MQFVKRGRVKGELTSQPYQPYASGRLLAVGCALKFRSLSIRHDRIFTVGSYLCLEFCVLHVRMPLHASREINGHHNHLRGTGIFAYIALGRLVEELKKQSFFPKGVASFV